MKTYINTKTNEYPVYEIHIKTRGMGFSNYQEVFDTEKPSNNTKFQMCIERSPILSNDVYYKQYEIIDKSQAQLDKERQQTIDKKKKQLAAYRYSKETGGIALPNGTIIDTERDSQALITGAYTASTINPDIVIDWKGQNGWVQIGAPEITSIANAVTAHVQACFTREKELSQIIDASETPETVDILTGWPS